MAHWPLLNGRKERNVLCTVCAGAYQNHTCGAMRVVGWIVVLSVLALPCLVLGEAPVWDWQCQTPGVGGLCALVCESGCFEGPLGYPGGCGFCKFCTPDVVMESPECVSTATRSGYIGLGNRLIEGQPGWFEDSNILVHDVNSWFESGSGIQMLPTVMTGLQCAKACQSVDGCNGWSFCWDPSGCGEPGECSSLPRAISVDDSCRDKLGMYPRCNQDGRFGPMACALHAVELSGNASSISTFKQGWTSGIVQDDCPKETIEQFDFNLTCTI